jgi:Domain of unknown function (DUF927)
MTLAEFLSRICPSTGYLYFANLWLPPNATKSTFVHHAFDDAVALAKGIKTYIARNPSEETYFAMASYRDKTRTSPKDGKERPSRTRDNVQLVQSFWIDIDCKGADANQYDTKAEGLLALSALVDKGDVPRPSIVVDSGNGLHVYWCLSEPLTIDEWQPYANGFRNRLVEFGLKIDAGITIDGARVLRPIGADNNKDPVHPKPVTLLKDTGVVHELKAFHAFRAFDRNDHLNMNGDKAGKSVQANGMAPLTTEEAAKLRELYGDFDADDMAIPLSGRPQGQFEMGPIIDRCQQMQEIAKVKGAGCLEPMWKATLLLAAACKDGEEWAHSLSEGHADYTFDETQAKFEEQRAKLDNGTIGATRCDHFATLNPTGCTGCPFHGQLNSPISLGRELATTTTLPANFTANAVETYQIDRDEEGNITHNRVCYGTFESATLLLHSDRTESEDAKLELRLVYRQKRGVKMSTSIVRASLNKLRSRNWNDALAQTAITFHPHEAKGLRTLMLSWAEQLQRTDDATQEISTISGWSRDLSSFKLGGRRVTAAGVTDTAQVMVQNDSPYDPKGTLEAWKALVALSLEDARPEHQLALAVAFGAPLARLVELGGCVFSLFSEATATGKSTTLRIGMSVWGRPIAMLHNFIDTHNAVLNKIGQNPHTPAFWDELRPSSERQSIDEFTSVLFQMAQGREKARSDRTGQARKSVEWNTLMAVGTNFSLREQLDNRRTDTSPERARLLEFQMPAFASGVVAKNLTAFAGVEDNYGHAWPIYMTFVIAHMQEVRAQLARISGQFFADVGDTASAEQARMWAKAVACAVVGAGIARHLKLVALDPKAIYDACVAAARNQVMRVDSDSDVVEIFKSWVRNNRRHWVVVDHRDPKAKRQASAQHPEPLPVHIELDDGKIYIGTMDMRPISEKLCGAGKPLALSKALDRAGLWKTVQNKVLGKATAQERSTGRSFVIGIDAVGIREAAENHLNGDLPRYDRLT